VPDMLKDYLIIDGTDEPADEFEYFAALQRQINSGVIWRMQGSAGRAAMDAIKGGACLCAFVPGSDYWGNRIPARTELQAATHGTYEYVEAHMGKEWADRMAAIDAPVAHAA
jgi:hypothetical protein